MLLPDNHLYEFGNFVLDARSRILLNDGTTVRLTPKAFETLLVLIRNGVQVVDKDQLMKEVWPDTFVEEGSLSRNIYELRKALGDDSSEPRYIETIPKRGYKFLAPVKASVPAVPQLDPASFGGEATIIEKHTFARVVSEEVDGSDRTKLISAATRLLPAGDAVGRKRKNVLAAAAVAALILTVAIGTFVLK